MPEPTTPALTPFEQQMLDDYRNKAAGNTNNVSTLPASQEWFLIPRPKDPNYVPDPNAPQTPPGSGLIFWRNPGYTAPKVDAPKEPTVFGSDDTGRYILDQSSPTGVKQLVPPHTPNADDEVKKALDREQQERLRTQRQNNEAAGFGYADDDTVAKRSLEARAANLDEKKYLQSKAADNEKIRQFDIERAAKDKTDAANIGLTTAQAGRTGAETAQIQQNVDVTKAKLPGELEQQAATLAGTQASTAGTQASTARTNQQIAQGNAPTVQTPPTGMSQWLRDPNTGAVTQGAMNPEYIPKTQAEIAARVGQIQTLMQQKGAEIQRRVDAKEITPEQGLSEYNAWHSSQVQPQLSTLSQAQDAAQFAQAKDAAEMRRQAMTTAQNAGTMSTQAFNAMREANPVGPGFAQQLNQVASKSPYMKGVDFGSTVWQGPNPVDLAQQQTQQALKYIDPTAGKALGVQMPDFNALDINGLLGAQPYAPAPQPPPGGGMPDWLNGTAPPPPAPVAPPAPQPVLPAGVAGTAADPRFSGMYGPPPYVLGG